MTAAATSTTTGQMAPVRDDQVVNAAGGYVFEVDLWTRLDRFLVLGTDAGTYYTSAEDLTVENMLAVSAALDADGLRAVRRIVEISEAGRAPRPNQAIFALALAAAHTDPEVRSLAMSMLPRVCRTGTHLFLFCSYVQKQRGWGRSLARGVGRWYADKDVQALTYQVLKYRQRNGWTHRDVLRKSHPVVTDGAARTVLDFACGREVVVTGNELLEAYTTVTYEPKRVLEVLERTKLSWEMLPTEALEDAEVWIALLRNGMPITAMVRNLPKMTRVGVFDRPSAVRMVTSAVTDAERLKKGRVHPMQMLLAARTYGAGESFRGSSTWKPVKDVVDALDLGFYAAFGAVVPAGKRTLIGLDVSGSMGQLVGTTGMTAREASTAMALVTMATEPECEVRAFTSKAGSYMWDGDTQFTPLSIKPTMRLREALRATGGLSFGATDCAIPALWAREQEREVDTFIVITDNESWAGDTHPHDALRQYREASGIAARMVAVAMTATRFSVCDPEDALSLDVVGFDTVVPGLVADFSAGRI